ncbi:sigma factor-like helix-turn-helix DNA-binding protein [Massilia orientalis]|uniref:Sigma factor-like helix-turn-helix DNA-binding protein n=1 Tax=Massilia orientalis TaxID=3050128 RepID=A0ACC7MDN5_9BURK|nr:sigma factor-like helix-turn-helix DNA-binding protein [Massilia sp. YIM B02787]
MSGINQGTSIAVRALDELPEDQREVYSARYVADETREVTCRRLNMDPAHYDQLLGETLRSLRRMAAHAPTCPAAA